MWFLLAADSPERGAGGSWGSEEKAAAAPPAAPGSCCGWTYPKEANTPNQQKIIYFVG